MTRNGHFRGCRTRWTSAMAIFAAVVVGLATSCSVATARPAVDDATKAYVADVVPALKTLGKVGEDVDAAILKAAKRSDKTNAARFAGLARRIKRTEVRLDRIEAPKQFAKPHEAYVRAVSRLASDVDLVSRAARMGDRKAATKAGFRLGRTVKALNKADKALGLALQRAAAPGDAASLSG